MNLFTRSHLKFLALASVLALAACGPWQERIKPSQPQMVAEPDNVTVMLADAADRAAMALETLAQVEQVRTPTAAVSTIPNAPAELRRGVTVEWTGPAEPMVEALSQKTGYTYQVFGTQPPVPLLINLKATNRPAIEVFRDIGLQLGSRANLNVDAQRRVVELYYVPVAQATRG